MAPKYDYYHILPQEDGTAIVKGYGTYGPSSVLAGQTKICYVNTYDSIEEAQAAYPDASLSNQYLEPINTFDHLPDGPDDGYFDEGDY
jgi:hypothetical protein